MRVVPGTTAVVVALCVIVSVPLTAGTAVIRKFSVCPGAIPGGVGVEAATSWAYVIDSGIILTPAKGAIDVRIGAALPLIVSTSVPLAWLGCRALPALSLMALTPVVATVIVYFAVDG